MTEKIISDLATELNIPITEAEDLLKDLPKEVVKMYHRDYQKKSFFIIAEKFYNGQDAEHRLVKTTDYLIKRLNEKYTSSQLADETGVSKPFIEAFLKSGEGLSLNAVNKLASVVDLTFTLQPIGEYYVGNSDSIQPPTIKGLDKEVYAKFQESRALPSPIDIGSEAVVKIVTIGSGDSFVAGEIKALERSYYNGTLNKGDYVIALCFDIPMDTMEWIKSIKDDVKSRTVMTIGSTEITAETIAYSTSQRFGTKDGYSITWTTFVKIPDTKKLEVKFYSETDVYISNIDFTQLRLRTSDKNVVILGGVH